MSSNLIDPLKVHTLGVKKPLEEKEGKIQQMYNEHKRYYPLDAKGDIDEWGAVIKRQTENYNREKQERQINKAAQAQAYGNDLNRQIVERRENENLEKQNRLDERQKILRAYEIKGSQDFAALDAYKQQQRQFGEHAKAIIDQKKQRSLQEAQGLRNQDREMIERDQALAKHNEMQRKTLADRQREEMRDQNLALMQQKRDRDILHKQDITGVQGVSPAYIGNGYKQQLAAMQEAERMNNIAI